VKWLLVVLCFAGLIRAQETEGNFQIRVEPIATLPSGVPVPIQVVVRDDRRKPLTDATVTVQVGHPDGSRAHTYPAPATNPGSYLAKPTFGEAGEWSVYVEVRRGNKMTARTLQYTVPQ
jgi:hypothetical protein